MKIYRLSPERYEANQRKRRAERDGTTAAKPSDPYAAAIGFHKARVDANLGNPEGPSPAFKKALGDVRKTVEGYMAGKGERKARAFILRLPVPQSVNANTLPTVSGGRILTDEHKAFRAAVAIAVFDAKLECLYGRLRAYIRVSAPRVDIDNIIKPTLDALQRAGAIQNDRNIDDLHIVRAPAIPEGFLDIEVAEL